jgi:hypothetical protein
VLLLAASLAAASTPLSSEQAIQTAVAACEAWILDPKTWADDIARFPQKAGLAGRLQLQKSVPEPLLPPPSLRRALHSWRVPVGSGGVFLTVSDQVPFCHIAGGGPDDFQPGTESALRAFVSSGQWKKGTDETSADIVSTQLVSNRSKKFTMVVSRAARANSRRDRVQVLATAQYGLEE